MHDTIMNGLKKENRPVGADRRVYFDNAATTALGKEVLEAMLPYMTDHFGNPSSIYSYGRETRIGKVTIW